MQKTKVTVANNTAEYVAHILIPVLQAIALILVAVLDKTRSFTYGILIGVLAVLFVFFAFMLIYKLYRARLTLVTFTPESITYRISFKKRVILADDIMITLCDDDGIKPNPKKRYCIVCDKKLPEEGFVYAIKVKNAIFKFPGVVPPLMTRFIVACTPAGVLEKSKADAMPELAEYIRIEEEAREKRREEAELEAKRNRKKKKH